MKIFIPIVCIVAVALAEPPVGDGYPSARSYHDDHQTHHHDHHASDHQRSLSQEYRPPSDSSESARNAPSDGYEYHAPNGRSSSNTRGRSQFPPATVRVSFNQRFSSAAARNSKKSAASSHTQEHTPNTRGISQEYGPPAARSLSQEYGVPAAVSARTLSTEYGMPDARSTPSREYGAPVLAARNSQKSHSPSNIRSAQPSRSQHHSMPAARSQFSDSASQGYSASSARSNEVSQGYDSSKSTFGARTAPLSTYGAPSSRSQSTHGVSSARNADSELVDSVSETYGTPNQKELSESYGTPSVRSHLQEHEVPSSITNLMTTAVASSFASVSSRSSPSSSYLPASRSAAPSEQYGTPEQRDGAAQGYDYARARALEEELKNQEPASYDFGYQIEDQESGSDFGHSETREADKAQGSYFIVRPDGSKQTVEYEADERGFKPRISVEPAPRVGGYDDNAQDLTRSADGPY